MPVFGGCFGGQRFVVHFVGECVGIFRGALLIVFVVFFLFLVGVVIGVQRFLQFLEFGGLDKCFGHGFDGLGAHFRAGLRFFVLGFGELGGERSNLRVGKGGAIYNMRVRDHRRAFRGIEMVEFVGDFALRVRGSFRIFRDGSGDFGGRVRSGGFVLVPIRC